MVGQVVISAAALTAGLRSEFRNTYRKMYEGLEARLSRIMRLRMPSDKLTELYAYFETAPHPRIWPRGDDISVKAFEAIGFNVTNRDWGIRVPWHENDRMDDQINSLFDQAKMAGRNFGLLPERVFFQILLNSTDADLLPAVPNAPDGVALFSATDGEGGARFGATGGNIVAGTGVGTAATIRTDFFSVISRYYQFQDTEGQPLWDPSIIDAGITVIYGAANERVFREAFLQERTAQILQNVAASENVAIAGVTNIVLASGLKVTLVPTQRILAANNDWFTFLEGTEIKPIFEQERMPLTEIFATRENSDRARDTGEEYIQWKARRGYGVAIPYAAVQVNN